MEMLVQVRILFDRLLFRCLYETYKFNPIPIASVATIILHGLLGSLNLAA